MEQSPSWKATRSSACQEIPHILCNMKVHYHIQKSWPLVPILSHMNPIQSTPSNCISLRIILILPTYLHLSLPNRIFSSGFPTKFQDLPLFSSQAAHHTPLDNMLRSTKNEAPHYEIFSILPLPNFHRNAACTKPFMKRDTQTQKGMIVSVYLTQRVWTPVSRKPGTKGFLDFASLSQNKL